MARTVGWLRFRLKYLTKLPARGASQAEVLIILRTHPTRSNPLLRVFYLRAERPMPDLLPQIDRLSHVKLVRPAERVIALTADAE